MGPCKRIIVPIGLRHLPTRNNYPDAVFDHDLANTVEACLPFVGVDGFLCDPQGATLRRTLLHEIFTNLCFCSQTIPGQARESAGRPEDAEKPVRERITGALAIAVTGITVLRTAGYLTSDHKGRSNALAGPAVNVVVRKKRVR